MPKWETSGVIYLAVSVINGACLAALPLKMPSSRVRRWGFAAWGVAMIAYFLIPGRMHALDDAYAVLGLATLPISAGIWLMRGSARVAGIVSFVAGLAATARGGWLFSHPSSEAFYLPIPSTSTVIEVAILGVIVVAVTWRSRSSS